jgi:hypothetical protein
MDGFCGNSGQWMSGFGFMKVKNFLIKSTINLQERRCSMELFNSSYKLTTKLSCNIHFPHNAITWTQIWNMKNRTQIIYMKTAQLQDVISSCIKVRRQNCLVSSPSHPTGDHSAESNLKLLILTQLEVPPPGYYWSSYPKFVQNKMQLNQQ